MNNNQNTKKALRGSFIALFLCIVMLIGTTFAWFTDSVSSGTNIIKSGNLDISATVHDLTVSADGMSGTEAEILYSMSYEFMQKGDPDCGIDLGFAESGDTVSDFEGNSSFMSDSLFEPGKTYVKMIRVTNNGDLAAKIKLHFDVQDGGLQDALWFAVRTDTNSVVSGGGNQINRTPMSKLNESLNYEIPVTENGDVVDILFAYGMNEDAGNEFMDKTFSAELKILATQAMHESDSFGNDYDENAAFPAASDEEAIEQGMVAKIGSGYYKSLTAAINNTKDGDKITLITDAKDSVVVAEGKTLSIDLGGHTLTAGDENSPAITNSGTITSLTNGTIKATLKGSYAGENKDSGAVSNTGKIDTLNVDVQANQGAALRNDGTIGEIAGGSYTGHPDKYNGGDAIDTKGLLNKGTIGLISAGHFQGAKYAVKNSGTIKSITGGTFDSPFIDDSGYCFVTSSNQIDEVWFGDAPISISGGTWYCLDANSNLKKVISSNSTYSIGNLCQMTSKKTYSNGKWITSEQGAEYYYYNVTGE